MSNQARGFIGRLDKKEESIVMSQLQEKAFLQRLLGNRDPSLVHRMYGLRRVRDVYVPPTRGVDGSAPVMPKN